MLLRQSPYLQLTLLSSPCLLQLHTKHFMLNYEMFHIFSLCFILSEKKQFLIVFKPLHKIIRCPLRVPKSSTNVWLVPVDFRQSSSMLRRHPQRSTYANGYSFMGTLLRRHFGGVPLASASSLLKIRRGQLFICTWMPIINIIDWGTLN